MTGLNEQKLHELLGTMVTEMGAAVNGALVIIGDRLGLFRALAQQGPLTSQQLADKTGTTERYVREWASAQAASGYIQYDPASSTFSMTPEQQAVLSDSESPFLMTGGFYVIEGAYRDEPMLAKVFKTGEGVAWGEHHNCLFCGTEKFFRPSYTGHLIQDWIPALSGVTERLKQGARVADVGCGHGVSTLVMAKAFPKSEFFGFDFHPASIERCNALAAESGLGNVRFQLSRAKEFPGGDYDLVCMFDCLHDMGDPVGTLAYIRSRLSAGGTCMIVEPFAHDHLEDNLNPVGRVYYGFSTMVCTPASLSQEVGLALGAQAGEKRLREVAVEAGFQSFRRAFETPFNLVFEARG